jgi:predicted GIY-YIG superfamily endonuclease
MNGVSALASGVYILQCADEIYYVGSTRAGWERRMNEHNGGV